MTSEIDLNKVKDASPADIDVSAGQAAAGPEFIKWFRSSSPYIHAHRGKTFVVLLPGEVIESVQFVDLIHDLALLNSLGIKLVLVHGARPQIEHSMQRMNIKNQFHNNLRVTDEIALQSCKEAIGSIRIDVESALSQGLINTPMSGAKIRVSSGNFVTAKPLGVIDGIDFQHTGKVRRIDTEAIMSRLDAGDIVLLSPIGYSPSGEAFNLESERLACDTAIALKADKLLMLIDNKGLMNKEQKLLRHLSINQAQQLFDSKTGLAPEQKHTLESAIHACKHGIDRVHVIDQTLDGALLIELFSRDGCGTLINANPYEIIRQANTDDVAGIIELIQPLEDKGVLVKRSREHLEMDIGHFTVIERDGMIIGCAALYPDTDNQVAEMACLSVHPDYKNNQLGKRLLDSLEIQARDQHVKQIFALTTQSAHWFKEQGFSLSDVSDLPAEKQSLYNYQRNSKVYVKSL
jgi:amino-acid N-acetyltransferase